MSGDEVRLLDTSPDELGVSSASSQDMASSGWLPLVGAALVGVLAVLAFSIGGGDPALDEAVPSSSINRAPTTNPPSTIVPDLGSTEPLEEAAPEVLRWPLAKLPTSYEQGEMLVGIGERSYFVIDPIAGEVRQVPLNLQLERIGYGLDTNTFNATASDGKAVFIVLGESSFGLLANVAERFAFSATPGRAWIGVNSEPDLVLETDQFGIYYDARPRSSIQSVDPRFVYEPGGGLYLMGGALTELVRLTAPSETIFLGPHEPLASSIGSVVGRRCDPTLQCWIEQYDLADGVWDVVTSVPNDRVIDVTVSSDGAWVGVVDDGLRLYPRSDANVEPDDGTLEWPDATEVAFSSDAARAYVFDAAGVTLVDLDSGETSTVQIPPQARMGGSGWTAVSAQRPLAPVDLSGRPD